MQHITALNTGEVRVRTLDISVSTSVSCRASFSPVERQAVIMMGELKN